MGHWVVVVLGAAVLALACGDSEDRREAPPPTAGGDANGGSATAGSKPGGTSGAGAGGARADTSGGRSQPSGGSSATAASPSTFGGLTSPSGGGAGRTSGGEPSAAASGGEPPAAASGGEPSAGAPAVPECPEPEPPSSDPEDGGRHEGALEIVAGLEAALGTYSVIGGNLTIGPSSPPTSGARIEGIDLSHLRVVEGDLLIRNTALTALELPRLERVDGQVFLSLNLELRTAALPRLESAYSLYLDTNLELLEADFGALEAVTQTLYVHRNQKLVNWGLYSLTSVGSVIITANPSLPQCLIDALNEATGEMASSIAIGGGTPPNCDCPEECGRIVPDCEP